ncbi:MAG TPA: hypothetical protein QF762_03245 [Acidimicrobiales bacterium]|nr:hypothetical protein [Acidimicrobiales bacterium]|tara:strand:+ start:2748 stop:4109 length:1362 start_codon:yes stop_codon:yes gene_type:complete
MFLKRPLLVCILISCSIAAACSASTSEGAESLSSPTTTKTPATTEAPTTTKTPATTEAPTTTIDPSAVEDALQLENYIAQAASFSQSDAAWLLPTDLTPKAGGAPGYTRYVFRETSNGVVPTLVEGPIGAQTRCDQPSLPCSYLDLVDLKNSGDNPPSELNMSQGDLNVLVDQLDTLSTFALSYTDVDTACSDGFISDQIQTPNMGSHFYKPEFVADGIFDPAKPEILIYAPADGSLHQGSLGRCRNGVWEGPSVVLTGTAFILPPNAFGSDHPEAFVSDLDNWHAHFNLCRGRSTGSDSFVTKQECEASGGNWNDAIGWMLHAWVVPDFDSQLGVFSMWNSSIAPVSTSSQIAGDRLVRGSDFPEGAQQSLISNFAFDPVIEVDVGQSVFFNNSDSVPHTVSAGTPDAPNLNTFDSGLLNPGDNYELDTSQAGSFTFFCALHPDMTATVIVG